MANFYSTFQLNKPVESKLFSVDLPQQLLLLIACFYLLLNPVIAAETDNRSQINIDYKTDLIAQNLGVIWGMDWVSDSQLIMTARSGHVYLFDLMTKQKTEISGLPEIQASGQGGLLDVARFTDSDQTTWFYFTYVKPVGNYNTATTLARAQLDPNKSQLINWQDLLVTDSAADSHKHFGSRISFDQQGHVFFGVGDRGERDNGQKTDNQAASVLRLNLDGSLPNDNPFIDDDKINDAVWSYGHRNPQGLVFDRDRNILWEVEHGPRGGDEINIIKKGANYGWANTSHGKEYWGPFDAADAEELPGIESPTKVYIPSIAPSSATIYQGDMFNQLNGALLIGALAGTHINIVLFDSQNQPTQEIRIVESLEHRVREITVDKQGIIYFSTDSGNLYQITSK